MCISLDVLPYKEQSHKKDTTFMSVARKPARSLIPMSTRAIKTEKYGKTFTFIELVPSKKANSYYRVKRK